MKVLKYILIILTTVVIFAFISWVFFAGYITSVYSPLGQYYFSNDLNYFEDKLTGLGQEKALQVFFTDTTGLNLSEPKYYFTITDTNLEYRLSVESDYSIFYGDRVQLNLIGIFNKSSNTGGYKNSDNEIDSLLIIFENNILKKLEMSKE